MRERIISHAENRGPRSLSSSWWLRAYMATYYDLPPLAFWRALEARELGDQRLPSPSLDVGGSDGTFAATWLGSRPPIDVGLDIEPGDSAYSKRAYGEVVTGDAQFMPFASGSFSSILCNSVIEHIPDEARTINEFGRILKPGGLLLLTTPSVYFHDFLYGVKKARARGDEVAAAEYIRRTDARLMHLHYRTIEEWTALLGTAGLSVVSHSYYLPSPAIAFWDRWDKWFVTPFLGGRTPWRLLGSKKVARVVPPRIWPAIFTWMFGPAYRRAIEDQSHPGCLGGSLYIKAYKV